MSSSDDVVYDLTLEDQADVSKMLDKQVVWVADSNNGVYNGQIQLDTSSLASSGKWLDYRDAYLEIPFVVSAKSSADVTSDLTPFSIGMKNGFHQLIHSLQVDYNNVNVIELRSFNNIHITYRLLKDMSQDDLQKHGRSIMFYPDTADSVSLSSGASVRGNGLSNNQVFSSSAITYASSQGVVNEGYLQRLKWTSYNGTGAGASNGLALTGANANQVAKPYYVDDQQSGAARIYSWVMVAQIRLRDLHDYFEKVPLCRSGFYNFTINYNSARISVACVNSGDTLALSAPTSVSMLSGQTVPIMVSSTGSGQPIPQITADGTLTIECNVRQTTNPAQVASPVLTQCRLYVPAYVINPVYEERLLRSIPQKTIEYDDIYFYRFTVSSSQFNQLITNGIKRPTDIVIVPVLSSGNGSANLIPYQSCFDSSPATTAPLTSLKNLNVQLAGKTVFQQNQQYDFQNWMDETSKTGLNGGEIEGLSSGLLSQYDWETSYRYYTVDLSRRLPSDEQIPVSVFISGEITAPTGLGVDLFCFISYRKRLTVDMQSGSVVAMDN